MRSFVSIETLQRRSFGIVFFVLGLFALSHVAEYATVSYFSKHWDATIESKSAEQIQAVRTAFTGVQRKVRRIAAELARHPDITNYLVGNSTDLGEVFDQVSKVARNQEVSAEVYDRTGTLIAWQGRSGVVNKREIQIALQGVLTSYVSRGPIYSQLFVISPVRVDGIIAGAIIIRQAVEVNYPLSNKFITRAGLADQLSQDLDVSVEINYGENAEPRIDGRYASTELNGIDGRKLGVANILRLSRTTYLESLDTAFDKFNAFLLLVLLAILIAILSQWIKRVTSLLLCGVLITAVIWLARYALLFLEIPSVFFHSGVFDPSYFASKFGGGIAKSIGEMMITSLALVANIIMLARLLASRNLPSKYDQPFYLRILLSAGLTTFLFLLLRGYAAIIRSAVFDSNLRFNDPNVIVPSLPLGLMMFDLFALSLSFIVIAVSLTRFLFMYIETGCVPAKRRNIATMSVACLFALVSLTLGLFQENPLMSASFRLMIGATIFFFALYLHRGVQQRRPLLSFSNAIIVLILSEILFYPLFAGVTHDRDRDRVEVFARDVLRPVDAWLKFVVEESLQTFVTDETFDVMLNGAEEEVDRLAFTCWAKSTAAKQGYNCVFIVLNPDKEELSRFAIGEQNDAVPLGFHGAPIDSKDVTVREIGSGVNAVKIYSASIPIIAADQVLGYGVVIISAAQQTLFRGESPTVFRTTSQEELESFYRPVTVNEFHGTSLFTSNNASLPIGYKMPVEVETEFRNTRTLSLWHEETIGDSRYETFYIRRSADADQVIGLSVQSLDVLWHLFGIGRVLVYFAAILAASFGVVLVLRWLRGNPYRITFRNKLLLALLVTAIIPVVVIATYSRVFARERLRNYLSSMLKQETTAVAEVVLRREPGDSTGAAVFLHDVQPERIATHMHTDFNFYIDRMLKMSSRPELYETGILDRRISGSAYASVVTRGQRFHLEGENIGLYRYAVGYEPIIDATGAITSIISVPTLYRQEEIDEEVARINAVLFGISALIIIVITVIATTLANRIAEPLQRLILATKRISAGDLDVKVNARADGEIGELIQAFETMTKDLKASRENLVQYERELAWKEMAKQVAHEIKNPLTPMKLALQHLRQTYRDKVENFDAIFEEVSQMVIRQVDALSRIASEFSSFARMPAARLERCSVNDILKDAAYLFEHEHLITLDFHLASDLPPIMADREELRRAFINILRNGIQAMNNEGKILLTTSRRDHTIEIRIQDFGSGIPDEIKGKLFQPNFSTKTDGMGLGLAIVKKTIEDLNGTISMDSRLNEGTTVIIQMPIQPETYDVHPNSAV